MAQRRELTDRARRERQWATSAVRRERRDPEGQRQGAARLPDQPDREAGLTGPPDRAGHGTARIPWRSRGRAGTCASPSTRRPGRAPSWAASTAAVIARGDFRLGPINLEIGWARTDRAGGPERFGQDVVGRGPARVGCPWPRGRPGWGRASWWASSARTAARRPGTVEAVGIRPRRRHRPVRADGSRGAVAAGQVRAGRRASRPAAGAAVAGGADPGRAGHVPGPSGQLPRAGRAHQPPRPPRRRADRAGAVRIRRDRPARLPRPPPARRRRSHPAHRSRRERGPARAHRST